MIRQLGSTSVLGRGREEGDGSCWVGKKRGETHSYSRYPFQDSTGENNTARKKRGGGTQTPGLKLKGVRDVTAVERMNEEDKMNS